MTSLFQANTANKNTEKKRSRQLSPTSVIHQHRKWVGPEGGDASLVRGISKVQVQATNVIEPLTTPDLSKKLPKSTKQMEKLLLTQKPTLLQDKVPDEEKVQIAEANAQDPDAYPDDFIQNDEENNSVKDQDEIS